MQTGMSLRWMIIVRFSQFVCMGLVFWRYRSRRLLPTSAAERQLWTIWIGYLVACTVTAAAHRLRFGLEAAFELGYYVPWTVLTGLAFFILGSSYWGWCYVLGCAFFGMALFMSARLDWAPLEFGGLWTLALVALGLRLHRLGAQASSRLSGGPPASAGSSGS
jgi:hypothetical protein